MAGGLRVRGPPPLQRAGNVAVDDGLRRGDDDVPWHEGEPNDWAGSEDCGMVCDHLDGGLNDGPCHNTIHCICEEGLEDLVRYDEGQCPEPDWAGWYTLAFLLGFFFWLCAIYGCAGLPQMCSTHKNFANGACLVIVLFCILLSALWEYIVEASYGMNAGVHTSGMVGAAVGFLAAIALAAYTRHRMAPTTIHQTRRRWRWSPSCLRSKRSCRSKFRPNSYPGMPVQVRIPRRPHCQCADSTCSGRRPDHTRSTGAGAHFRQQRGHSGRRGVPSGARERAAAGRGTVRHLPGDDPGRPLAASPARTCSIARASSGGSETGSTGSALFVKHPCKS